MINEEYLTFDILTQPNKELFKTIQSNAKFKTIADILKTKVGINNFYNFGIQLRSTIILRDIILNSQFVSSWARSTQVLNDNDSKFSVYKFLTRTTDETKKWITHMENLEAKGHSMDNMRSLIFLDSITDYSISIDILHLLYLTIILDNIHDNLDNSHLDLKQEINWFKTKFDTLLKSGYDVDYNEFKNMSIDAIRDFPSINMSRNISLHEITYEPTYNVNATYSVVGQIWRHRTLVKKYAANTYSDLVSQVKNITSNYDFSSIGMHEDIAKDIIEYTKNAKTIYDICQGSIVPFEFSGTVGAVYKALSQRTCFINDSPQFKDAFDLFKQKHPELKLIPPCKLNATCTNNCYVGYVNESRRRGEELTQVVCPIYAKSRGYTDDLNKSIKSSKTQWYFENLDFWKNVCK